MSGDPEQEYFSDGITEDIITDLGKVSALSIVSRNTAFSFKGAHADVAQIARQTKASYVLVGSVRKSGARVRITAQLIGAANDAQVWGERYDRDLNDIFALQDEISKAIVAALRLTLLPAEKQALEQRGTTNPEAYKLYLMARQFWLRDNERDNEIVVRICNRVVEIDRNYAQAWATMALAQWNMFWRGDSGDDGERAAGTALRLDPNLADSHAAMGAAHRSKGRFEEGLSCCENALRLEPDSYVGNRIAGLCCFGLRRYDDAIAHFELAAAAMESDFTASTFISQSYKAKGDVERMRSAARMTLDRIEKIVAADPGHSRAIGMGVACWQPGREGTGQRVGNTGASRRSRQRQPSLQSRLRDDLAGRDRSDAGDSRRDRRKTFIQHDELDGGRPRLRFDPQRPPVQDYDGRSEGAVREDLRLSAPHGRFGTAALVAVMDSRRGV